MEKTTTIKLAALSGAVATLLFAGGVLNASAHHTKEANSNRAIQLMTPQTTLNSNIKLTDSTISTQPTANQIQVANKAFDQLKSFVNTKMNIGKRQLVITDSNAIKAYVAAHFKELSVADSNLTQQTILNTINSGVQNINNLAQQYNVDLNSDGSIDLNSNDVATMLSYNESKDNISVMNYKPQSSDYELLSSYVPYTAAYWWGKRFYSTDYTSSVEMAHWFTGQSNAFWYGTIGAGALGILSAGFGFIIGAGTTEMAVELGQVSSDISNLISLNKAGKGINADMNIIPTVHSVYAR